MYPLGPDSLLIPVDPVEMPNAQSSQVLLDQFQLVRTDDIDKARACCKVTASFIRTMPILAFNIHQE